MVPAHPQRGGGGPGSWSTLPGREPDVVGWKVATNGVWTGDGKTTGTLSRANEPLGAPSSTVMTPVAVDDLGTSGLDRPGPQRRPGGGGRGQAPSTVPRPLTVTM